MFHLIQGNRTVDRVHVERLKKSFSVQYLLSPIIVNQDGGIIDGQHRFTAAKEYDLPIFFIRINNFGLKEVQLYNMHSKNWTKKDFLNMHCENGLEEYIKFREFMNEYPEFGMSACMTLVSDKLDADKKWISGKDGRTKSFQEGLMIVGDLKRAHENALKIRAVKPYQDGYNRGDFVKAMVQILKVKG